MIGVVADEKASFLKPVVVGSCLVRVRAWVRVRGRVRVRVIGLGAARRGRLMLSAHQE